MARYNSYKTNINNLNDASTEARTANKVNEVNHNVNDLRSDVLKLQIMVQAMMEIMVEQGISVDLINEKIDKIVEDPDTFAPKMRRSEPCPSCGHMIVDNGNTPLSGTCLYCGKTIRFAPHYEPRK